jgi:hypothetical protein|tara:strand:- start:838 stop:1131 length:294 start_codon:yes stop_codon:yes gene_type:complete
MNIIKVASIVGVLMFVGYSKVSRADGACPEPRFVATPIIAPLKAPDNPTAPKVVGDYSFVDSVDVFLPNTLCTVDKSLSLLVQLQQCRSQRKGWLKL